MKENQRKKSSHSETVNLLDSLELLVQLAKNLDGFSSVDFKIHIIDMDERRWTQTNVRSDGRSNQSRML